MDLEMLMQTKMLEREKQILYINACMWDLEKLYRWTYLRGRNIDTDVENRCVDVAWGKGGGMRWETGIDTYCHV